SVMPSKATLVLRLSTVLALPAEAASCECPSVISMMTSLEVIGWPLLKLSAMTEAWLGSCASQVSKLPRTKSESVAVGLWEERVSARKVEKQAFRPREVRFTPSSRNSPGKATFPGVLLLLV